VLIGMAANPNVYGVICIGLGCEINRMDEFIPLLKQRTSKPVEYLIVPGRGRTINAVARRPAGPEK
jgi:altronate dehydratase large subunit